MEISKSYTWQSQVWQAFGLLLWPAVAGGRLTFLSGAYLCNFREKHLQTLQQYCLCWVVPFHRKGSILQGHGFKILKKLPILRFYVKRAYLGKRYEIERNGCKFLITALSMITSNIFENLKKSKNLQNFAEIFSKFQKP